MYVAQLTLLFFFSVLLSTGVINASEWQHIFPTHPLGGKVVHVFPHDENYGCITVNELAEGESKDSSTQFYTLNKYGKVLSAKPDFFTNSNWFLSKDNFLMTTWDNGILLYDTKTLSRTLVPLEDEVRVGAVEYDKDAGYDFLLFYMQQGETKVLALDKKGTVIWEFLLDTGSPPDDIRSTNEGIIVLTRDVEQHIMLYFLNKKGKLLATISPDKDAPEPLLPSLYGKGVLPLDDGRLLLSGELDDLQNRFIFLDPATGKYTIKDLALPGNVEDYTCLELQPDGTIAPRYSSTAIYFLNTDLEPVARLPEKGSFLWTPEGDFIVWGNVLSPNKTSQSPMIRRIDKIHREMLTPGKN